MIQFGTKVAVSHKLVRLKLRGKRRYQPVALTETIQGFVCRTAWLKEGKVEAWDDGGVEFKETATIKAYQVAWHNSRKPLLVLPEHLVVLED
jgi:hypothetical protein